MRCRDQGSGPPSVGTALCRPLPARTRKCKMQNAKCKMTASPLRRGRCPHRPFLPPPDKTANGVAAPAICRPNPVGALIERPVRHGRTICRRQIQYGCHHICVWIVCSCKRCLLRKRCAPLRREPTDFVIARAGTARGNPYPPSPIALRMVYRWRTLCAATERRAPSAAPPPWARGPGRGGASPGSRPWRRPGWRYSGRGGSRSRAAPARAGR